MKEEQFKSFYTSEAIVYQERRYQTRYGRLFRTLHHESIKTLVENVPRSSRVLEVACGTGHTTVLLSALGFEEVIACDLTPAMMTQARQRIGRYDRERVCFVETNAVHLPFPDETFDLVLSTRFLHLFTVYEQKIILLEMLRVLKPGGYILVDFDNWFSRWLLAVPYVIYNMIRYRRIAPFSIYNKINETQRLIESLSVDVKSIVGIAGTHLVVPCYLSEEIAIRLGRFHKHGVGRLLAEQFIIFGGKR